MGFNLCHLALSTTKNQRKIMPGSEASLLWLRNPVGEDGVKQLFRVMNNMLGPKDHRISRNMRNPFFYYQ